MLKKIRKSNNEGRMRLIHIFLIFTSVISFFAYVVLKLLYPQAIVGGQNSQVEKNYSVKATDSTLIDGSLYQSVFGDTDNCHENFPLGAPVLNDESVAGKSALFCYKKYAVQYNANTKTPIWESHVLRKKDFKGAEYVERTNDFREDKDIQGKPFSSSPQEYTRSGYDRGHLAPAADFSYNKDIMSESFYMTNIAPQAPQHNRQIWSRLEQAVRKLAKHPKIDELYVTTGVAYYRDKGIGWGDENGSLGTIGRGILVPTYFYKIIIEPKTGQSAAYLIPNANNVGNQHFNNFLIKISDLEKITQINFNPQLDSDTRKKIEVDGGTLAKSLN